MLFHLIGFGQVIKGTVRDKETQEPLGYATISIPSQNLRVIAHRDGTFSLNVSQARDIDSIGVSYIGYQTVNYALSDIAIARNQQFELQPLIYTIAPVVVTAKERQTQNVGFTKRVFRRTGWSGWMLGVKQERIATYSPCLWVRVRERPSPKRLVNIQANWRKGSFPWLYTSKCLAIRTLNSLLPPGNISCIVAFIPT